VTGGLRVMVDASIVKPQQTGIATYTRSLTAALSQHLEVVVLTSESSRFAELDVEVVALPKWTQGYVARQVWRGAKLRSLAHAQNVDIVIIPAPEVPLARLAVPLVCVVYDVGPLVKPQFFPWSKRVRFRALIGTLRRATAIVAISQSTARDLQGFLGGDDTPVAVIGAGVEQISRLGERLHSSSVSPYVLYVGMSLPHKNLQTLVEAARLVPGWRIVLAGPGTERYDSSFENVSGMGWVSSEVLCELMTGADLIVNPSLYEGLGLPALEAMAMGRPVLLSDIAVFREVAGDAAAYVVEPRSPSAWADAIRALVGDRVRLAELAAAGHERAQMWSWEQAADQFVALFDRLIDERAKQTHSATNKVVYE